jgi:hypothetical protein
MTEERPSNAPLPDLRGDVVDIIEQLYDDTLLNDSYQQLQEGQVNLAMKTLVDGLEEKRQVSSDLEWMTYTRFCLLHPVRRLVHQDPFTRRAFEKPGGDPGDPVLLDLIFGVEQGLGPPADTTKLGRGIFQVTTNSLPCEGVRARAHRVAATVDDLALERRLPCVLSVGAGHLWEAQFSAALPEHRLGRWVALDSDAESLQEVCQRHGQHGVETVAGTTRQILSGRLALGEFDLVYSTQAFDYLQQPLAQRVTKRLSEMLRPGGVLLLANFPQEMNERGYMETFMDWHLVYRSDREMRNLASEINPADAEVRVLAKELPRTTLLQIRKQ